jgi:hypothetical protein
MSKRNALTMQNILHSPFFSCGLAVFLFLILALLAYLRSRKLIKEWVAILIIVVVMTLALLVLTVNIE